MKNIQILVYSPNGITKINQYNNAYPDDTFDHPLVIVSAMTEDCYMLCIPFDRLDNLELQVGYLNTTITYIGCWDMDGSKTVFPEENEHRNFNKALYVEKLKVAESGIPYTEADINNARIDFFAGWSARDLS
jgi:hypothetical protein